MKSKPAPADEIAALTRVIDLLRQKLGARPTADLLESFALDLAAEADRQEANDPPAA